MTKYQENFIYTTSFIKKDTLYLRLLATHKQIYLFLAALDCMM